MEVIISAVVDENGETVYHEDINKEANNVWRTDIVHRKSKAIGSKLFRKCILQRENIVFPKVGGNHSVARGYVTKNLGKYCNFLEKMWNWLKDIRWENYQQ